MNEPQAANVLANRIVALIVGGFLILVFFGLQMTAPGLRITFRAPATASSPGEVYFWLGHALLLFPASCLLGYGFAPLLGPRLVRIRNAINSLSRHELVLGLLALVALAMASARLGRFTFLYDFPLTDDEYAAQYGGHIMASGRANTLLTLPRIAIPSLGLYFKDGYVSTADWPGAQAVWAVCDLTRLGPIVWALLAAIPVGALAVLVRRRLDAGWGLVATIVFLCSPMALMLSMTSHAHLGSRAMLALALTGYWFAQQRGSLRLWALTGLAFGLAFLFRPLEILFFSAPLLAWAATQSMRKKPGYSRALLALAVGGFVPILLMLIHAYSVTGNPFVPPRLDNPDAVVVDNTTNALSYRFGANMGYNTFMLAIWFLGPLGIILFTAGVMTDTFTRLLGLGVATDLSLALFHTNMGLHVVGPIHYSECAVPLTIIAVHGLANLLRWARRHLLDPFAVASAVMVTLTIGLGIFNLTHALALREQASVQSAIYGWIDQSLYDSNGGRAVVLAQSFGATWFHVPGMAQIGTFVYEWRRPLLDLSDDVLMLHDRPGVEQSVRSKFPDRRIYRLLVLREPPYVVLMPLTGGVPIPWPSTSTSVSGR
jgi:hypothetical protein